MSRWPNFREADLWGVSDIPLARSVYQDLLSRNECQESTIGTRCEFLPGDGLP
jgi:hypothetical protein